MSSRTCRLNSSKACLAILSIYSPDSRANVSLRIENVHDTFSPSSEAWQARLVGRVDLVISGLTVNAGQLLIGDRAGCEHRQVEVCSFGDQFANSGDRPAGRSGPIVVHTVIR